MFAPEFVAEALERLKGRADGDRFVIFSHEPSGTFVQFMPVDGGRLRCEFTLETCTLPNVEEGTPLVYGDDAVAQRPQVMAVPELMITEAESAVLSSLMTRFDLQSRTGFVTGTKPGSTTVLSYVRVLTGEGRDAAALAQFTLAVFMELFGLSADAALWIEEN